MTDFDLLLLKAEIYALKILLPPSLALVADQSEDREAALSQIEKNALAAIQKSAPSFATRQNQQAAFVQMAAGVVSVAVQTARNPRTADASQLQ
jgi:hypothetical protein